MDRYCNTEGNNSSTFKNQEIRVPALWAQVCGEQCVDLSVPGPKAGTHMVLDALFPCTVLGCLLLIGHGRKIMVLTDPFPVHLV
jgi:hypothetical protein